MTSLTRPNHVYETPHPLIPLEFIQDAGFIKVLAHRLAMTYLTMRGK